MQYHAKTEQTHIRTISSGDTVVHHGQEKTVCKKDMRTSAFMGRSIFGDTYRGGTLLVTRVHFPKFYKGAVSWACP